MCVQHLTGKMPVVTEILAKQHRGHFTGHHVYTANKMMLYIRRVIIPFTDSCRTSRNSQ